MGSDDKYVCLPVAAEYPVHLAYLFLLAHECAHIVHLPEVTAP